MNYFMLLTGAGDMGGSFPIILMVGMLAIMWLVMIRPQKKKEKAQREKINTVEVGDGITTIGGVIGRIVSIKEDVVVIETGADRTKLRFKRWAIQDVEKLNLDEVAAPVASAKEEK